VSPYFCNPLQFLDKQKNAEVAHLVEHDLAKVGVAGSSPVFRSKLPPSRRIFFEVAIGCFNPAASNQLRALVVELVDTQDLKSCGQQWPYRFKSDPGHN
jgi:hypothetical protein